MLESSLFRQWRKFKSPIGKAFKIFICKKGLTLQQRRIPFKISFLTVRHKQIVKQYYTWKCTSSPPSWWFGTLDRVYIVCVLTLVNRFCSQKYYFSFFWVIFENRYIPLFWDPKNYMRVKSAREKTMKVFVKI